MATEMEQKVTEEAVKDEAKVKSGLSKVAATKQASVAVSANGETSPKKTGQDNQKPKGEKR